MSPVSQTNVISVAVSFPYVLNKKKHEYEQQEQSPQGIHSNFSYLQKQPFRDILQNRCSQKFRKLHRKKSVLESLFNNTAGLRPETLLKTDPSTGAFL